MLAPDDAAVAARDPHLPGLRRLLDADAAADALATAFPDLRVTGATACYVRYKRATSCLIGYRIALADGCCIDAYARTHSRAGDPKLGKAVASAAQHLPGRQVAALLDSRSLVVLEPYDHDLPALVRMADPVLRSQLIGRAVDAAPVDGWTLARLRYKPERRWVGRVTREGGAPMLLKVQRPQDAGRAAAAAKALVRSQIPTSRLLGVSRRHGTTVHQWLEGACAADCLTGEDVSPSRVAAEVGGLLARLHAVEDARVLTRLAAAPSEATALHAAVEAIRALDPAAGDLAASLGAALRIGDLTPARPRAVHGDCSLDQVVLTGDGPVLIDLDRAAAGDPHSDLAQLLADLGVRMARSRFDAEPRLVSALLDAYVAAGGSFDRDRLARLTAARLIRLAPEPFRQRRPDWANEQRDLISRAAAAVAGQVAV